MKQKKILFEVKISESLCVGCNSCLDVCSKGNFKKRADGKAELVPEYKCIGCYKCCDSCLTKAIKILMSGGRFFTR